MLSTNLPVIYEDDDLIVINKPSGLRVIADGYHPEYPSVRSLLTAQMGRIYIVHRLDKDTSGILLVAKNAQAHKLLNSQFEKHQIQKIYYAIVISPIPFPPLIKINQPLKVNGDRRHRTIVQTNFGKPALTEFFLIEQFQSVALVTALPKSGYTHQIRAHALAAGYPLLGDDLYQFPSSSHIANLDLPPFLRPALHAYQISFIHPRSMQNLTFTCPLPIDFENYLNYLRNKPEN